MDPYPLVNNFLTELDTQNPCRGLAQYTCIFDEIDIYNINEIAQLGQDKLISELHMTLGNAAFLFGAVEKEMKKVDRANHKTKKPRLS
jgi:hypothetical protein